MSLPRPYAQDRPKGEFPVQAAFVPLAPGAVEPEGWLRDWAMAARDGITGHLDEYHPTFRDAWTDLNLDARTATFQKIIGPLEQGAYWLDGLLRLGYLLHDEHLIHKAEAHLKPVVEGVNHGADSFIYYWKLSEGQAVLPDNIDWQTKQRLPMLPSWMKLQTMRPTWFGWAQSHMGRTLVAWYQATGDNRILDALVRAYAGHPLPMGRLRFDAGDTYIVSGLCNIDAMLETYRLSADRRILERVRTAMGDANVQAALREWRDGRFLPGHAVCALEQIRLPALFYLATGRQECLEASRQAFRWVEANHLLPYGVSSGEEFFSGIGAFRCTETCNIVAQIWSSLWLYRVCGERSFGDRIERAFFNAGPACVARDFQTMCYYQSPNRIQCGSLPDDQPASPGTGCHLFTRLGYPPVLCCVGAVNRLVPNYVMHLWMATPDQGLAATLYGPCKVSAAVGANTHVKLVCQTAYPFEETVRVTVEPDQPASFPLYFRIPGWCAKPRITVNQGVVPALADANGFVRIQRPWAKGDSVVLEFPMSVRLTRGFETEYPPSTKGYFNFKPLTAFEKRRLPYECISYGPLLFALAIPDKDPNTPAAGARWKYALDNQAQRGGADIKVRRQPMPAKWDWPLAAPLVLEAPAKSFNWQPIDDQALPAAPVEGGQAESICLIPYGCTKFRISMFPVTPRSWPQPPDQGQDNR